MENKSKFSQLEVWCPLSTKQIHELSKKFAPPKILQDPLLVGITPYGNCVVLAMWDEGDLDSIIDALKPAK